MYRTTLKKFSACALLALVCFLSANSVQAQTTAFTYQGSLVDGANPANGPYDLQFTLYAVLTGGTRVSTTLTFEDVPVSNGGFTVTLDFGAAAFPGAPRFLQIEVRPGASVDAFTPLIPRYPITSTPYAIKSAQAGMADKLSASCVNCVTSSQIGSLPTGSGNYVQNTTAQQAAANFNISGNGTAGGTLSGNIVNAATQFNLDGKRVLIAAGNSIIAGVDAGSTVTGASNTFFGGSAGKATTGGGGNAFFGLSAGLANTVGYQNTFIGTLAGDTNTTGWNNTVLGTFADVGSGNLSFATALGSGAKVNASNTVVLGRTADTVEVPGILNVATQYNLGGLRFLAAKKGSGNTFTGIDAGYSTSGSDNSFFGEKAALNNTTGYSNSFFGSYAGSVNTQGDYNSYFGFGAGVGSFMGNYNSALGSKAGFDKENLSYATAIGADARVSTSNTVVLGRPADTVRIPGNLHISGTVTGIPQNFIQNTNTQQSANFNISGSGTLGGNLTANMVSSAKGYAINGSPTLRAEGTFNIFVGNDAGTGGTYNSFLGSIAGHLNTSGSFNTFVGTQAGFMNTTGSNNTALGYHAWVQSGNLSYATAIGAGTSVNTSNTVVLGRSQDTVRIPGNLVLGNLGVAGITSLCWNPINQISTCSSSARYKTNVQPLLGGLEIIKQLHPVTFTWKAGQQPDLGLIAEEVAEVEPLLSIHNDKGEIEGVKYAQLNVILINAIKQQQQQIEALKKLVCADRPQAEACRPNKATDK